MRRLALIMAVLAAATWLAGPRGAGGSDTITVAAIFDNASGVYAGNEVRVVGVPVGTVDSVDLTDNLKARVVMSVSSAFAPFSADARCAVLPQSLIGERFVQCDPGSPGAGQLAAGPDGVPTVPVQRTSAPVDLDLVFALQLPIRTPVTAALPFGSLALPYRERLAIVVNELGAGLAGQGENVNAIIRRGAPALQNVTSVLRILNRQRTALRAAIADSNRVLAAAARDPHRVAAFIHDAADVTGRTALHQAQLEAAVRRLPGLLRQAQPALDTTTRLARRATPVTARFGRAAPRLDSLLRLAGRPLAEAGIPALDTLARTASVGRRALAAAGPGVARLRTTAARLRSVVPTLASVLSSLVRSGGTEGLLRLAYNGALATSRYDATSHILPVLGMAGACTRYDTGAPIASCSARFRNSSLSSAAPARPTRRTRGRDRTHHAGAPPVEPAAPAPQPHAGGLPRLPRLPHPGDVLHNRLGRSHHHPPGQAAVRRVLDFILGR